MKEYTLYRFNGVPVVAQPVFFPIPFMLWGLMTWLAGLRHPGWSWLQRLLGGALASQIATAADLGHAMAHTESARLAGAPMDKILLSSGMPRTLYNDNDVPPATHIKRASGGLVYNTLCLALSLLWRSLSRPGSYSRDLADLSCLSQGFILGASLVPMPMVDGGTILKWKLVERGETPVEAEQKVKQTSAAAGVGLLGVGALLTLTKPRGWIAGGVLAVGGLAAIAAAKGILK
jgi:hypothetical protein